jgi:hypothetical protein
MVGHFRKDCKVKIKDDRKEIKGDKSNMAWLFMASANASSKEEWVLDSGASRHMTGDASLLENVVQGDGISIHCADGRRLESKGIGIAAITHGDATIVVKNVYHVPGLSPNLLSVARMVEAGNEVLFRNNVAMFTNSQGSKIVISKDNGMYILQERVGAYSSKTDTVIGIKELHERVGHVHVVVCAKWCQRGT